MGGRGGRVSFEITFTSFGAAVFDACGCCCCEISCSITAVAAVAGTAGAGF